MKVFGGSLNLSNDGNMRTTIGIDIGGTNIHGILMSSDGRVIKRHRNKTEADKPTERIIFNIINTINALMENNVVGIGLSIAGVVDKQGKFLFSPNIPLFKGLNIKNELKKRFNIKVCQENDANCFAIAEHTHGAGKNRKSMVGLIVGTGIGGGIILEDNLYKGLHGFAGEFGHSIIDPSGPKCSCGLNGDFESLCSGHNIVKRYYISGGKIKNADPQKIFNSKERIAKRVMKDTIKYMGIGISHITNAFDIDLVILGGGVSNLDFYDEVNESVQSYSNYAVRESIRVVRTKLGDFSGAIGAGIIAQNTNPGDLY